MVRSGSRASSDACFVLSTSGFLTTIVPLFLLFCATEALYRGDQEDQIEFFKRCPAQACGAFGSPEIRYPFRLDSSPPSCGAAGLILSCSDSLTILPLRSLPTSFLLSVDAINYTLGLITVKLEGPSWSRCLLQNLRFLNFSSSSYSRILLAEFSLVNCSQRIPLFGGSSDGDFAGPISCLGGASDFVYAMNAYLYMDRVPSYCVVISNDGWIPNMGLDPYLQSLSSLASSYDAFVQRRQIMLSWSDAGIAKECAACEFRGGMCGFSQRRNQSFCYKSGHRRSNVKLIVGTSVGGALVILLVSAFFMYRKTENKEEMQMKIERFLLTYKNTNPMRYTYSDIKKITMRFKQRLGQGGFGSVYKGILPSGIPVAVKMIETSRSEGDEFINEVATIGRIHHINVVCLLGFCSEGNRRALVYEFMPNESLEKFIFPKQNGSVSQHLSMEKLQEIAIGIAQGIEYLHQGCDQRILHFDIKPHNILLDHNLVPKISDFGLAKLCSRDQSMITMTAARGTMGYIAPEIYCRNFGKVSYKSDVYSFGVLLLEMVSGRKNVDPSVDNQSDIYFPEWIYEQLVRGKDLSLVVERRGQEVEIAKKLLVVSLWCIQWNPVDRPTMTRVVQMLLGKVHGLEIPPKPFVSSSVLESLTSIDVL